MQETLRKRIANLPKRDAGNRIGQREIKITNAWTT